MCKLEWKNASKLNFLPVTSPAYCAKLFILSPNNFYIKLKLKVYIFWKYYSYYGAPFNRVKNTLSPTKYKTRFLDFWNSLKCSVLIGWIRPETCQRGCFEQNYLLGSVTLMTQALTVWIPEWVGGLNGPITEQYLWFWGDICTWSV